MKNALFLFIVNNPAFASVFIWPLVTAVFTAIFKRRSPEAYAKLAAKYPVWFFSRVAALTQLIGAIGVDSVKATEAIKKIVTGKVNQD